MTASIILNKDDDWETPNQPYNEAIAEYRIFPKLDVCATRENRKCLDFFTKEQDGLKQEWKQDFFMNPPYSDVGNWIYKAWTQWKKWNVNGLCLVFSKTDTKWWHQYVEGQAEVHFIKGRLRFCKDGISGKDPAPYPSCWIIWRRR